jgi:hypothetical protein
MQFIINPLTIKSLLHTRTHSVPRCEHSPLRLYKTNQLMLYREIIAVCSEIRTKHSTQSENHVECFNVKPGGT